MARKSRIDAPGALHHIIVRGIERRSIFIDTQDYQNFLERLGNILTDSSTACYAWVLMTNHAHLLLRTGMVHGVLLGRIDHIWQDAEYILKRFGASVKAARRSYVAFVSKGISEGRRPDLVGGGLLRSVGGWSALKAIRATGMRVMGDERILGSSDFVETVLKSANEEYEMRARFRSRGLSLEKVIDAVAGYFEIKKDEIKSQSRRRAVALARAAISIVAIEKMGFSGADVARTLHLTPSAVSKLVFRARNDPALKNVVNDVLNLP